MEFVKNFFRYFRWNRRKKRKKLKPGRVALTPESRCDLCIDVYDHFVEWHFQQALLIAIVENAGGQLQLPEELLRRVDPNFYKLEVVKNDNEYVFKTTQKDIIQYKPETKRNW